MPAQSPHAIPIPDADIRAALDLVVQASPFVRSGQLQRMLRFLVDETLAGRGDRLKEYAIGVDVFGRPASYDPRLDSLVRVEARRLRAALDTYYAGEGREATVVIELHKGSYVPSFKRLVPSLPDGIGGPPTAQSAGARGARRVSRTLAMVAVVAVVVAAASAISLLRSRRTTALADRDSILIAGFDNTTGETIFDETLKQGLAVGLEQSPFLNVVSDRRIARAISQMQRPAAERLNEELAREVCLRAGCRAMIRGSIVRLGARYVVSLTATECVSGDAFAHSQRQAASRERVLEALGDATADMRRKLGESLASVARFDTPIEQATTRSLVALQAYSLGRKTAREKGSPADIPYYERALGLDPDFAIAHAALGVSYVNLGQPAAAAAHLEKARALSDRASERERFRILAYYHHAVSGDLGEAREVYGMWKQSYPREFAACINLGVTHTWLGEYEKSRVETEEALRLEPGNVLAYSNLAALDIKLGKPDEAATLLQRAAARGLASKFVRSILAYLAFLKGDEATPARQLEDVRGQAGDEDSLLSQQSDTEAYFGRLRKARTLSRLAAESARRGGASEAAASWLANAALREAEFGNRAEARTYAREAAALSSGRDVLVLTALARARSGDARNASLLLREIERGYPLNTAIRVYWAPTIRAAIESARGNVRGAIETLAAVSPYDIASPPPIGLATMYPVYLRGEAYLRAADPASAAREFQRILDHPTLVLNFPLGVLARLQLARAKALMGDSAAASQAYDGLFDLWKRADPDLPALKAARSERARLHRPNV